MALSSAHQHEIYERSAISPSIAADRGYETVGPNEVPDAFSKAQKGDGLLIPIHNVFGEVAGYQLKRNEPREIRGKAIKYETPRGSSVIIDVPPKSREHIDDPYKPLWITEGAKKADSALSAGLPCVIDLSGVYNWRGSNKDDGLTALGDWEAIVLKGKEGPREVMLAFDSDIRTNINVQRAVRRLKRFLESRGANCKVLVMPDLPDGSKCGLDDWFANGGSL